MGMTKWGLTDVYVVSGGSTKSSYIDSNGQRYCDVFAWNIIGMFCPD